MFPVFDRRLAVAAALCLAPLGTAALADPAVAPQDQPAPAVTPAAPAEAAPPVAPAPAPAEPEAPAAASAKDDERICRYVKLDMSSRRKTKVCRTVEEWRELNNPR